MEPIKHEKLNGGILRYDHLLGRSFEHGVVDCYSILQDIYKDNLNILLADYARPDDWWINPDFDLYNQNFRNEGFTLVDDPGLRDLRILDVFLISIPDSRNMKVNVANHCAIYVGNGEIVHHRLGKLSQKVPYRYTMKDCTTAVIRHKDVPDLINRKEQQIDVMDLILPHKKEQWLGVINEGKNRTR